MSCVSGIHLPMLRKQLQRITVIRNHGIGSTNRSMESGMADMAESRVRNYSRGLELRRAV